MAERKPLKAILEPPEHQPVAVGCVCTCGICHDPWKVTFARVVSPVIVYILFISLATVWMLIIFSDVAIDRNGHKTSRSSSGRGRAESSAVNTNWESKLVGAVNILSIASVLSLAGLHVPRTAARVTVAIAAVATLVLTAIHAYHIAWFVFLPWVSPRNPIESALGVYVLVGEATIGVLLTAIVAGFSCCGVLT